jgi:hypothetical protein
MIFLVGRRCKRGKQKGARVAFDSIGETQRNY